MKKDSPEMPSVSIMISPTAPVTGEYRNFSQLIFPKIMSLPFILKQNPLEIILKLNLLTAQETMSGGSVTGILISRGHGKRSISGNGISVLPGAPQQTKSLSELTGSNLRSP